MDSEIQERLKKLGASARIGKEIYPIPRTTALFFPPPLTSFRAGLANFVQ